MADIHYKVVNGERIQFTAEEETELMERRAAADLDFTHVRMTRNGLLTGTDWTQIGDATLGDHTAEEWATYRQALRDYPASASKLSELGDWPKTPTKTAAGQAAYDAKIADGTLTAEETDAGLTIEQAAENARRSAENSTD